MLKEQLNKIRLKLLDTSMRNKFINYNLYGKKRELIIVDEEPNQIFDTLVHSGKKMVFDYVPLPKTVNNKSLNAIEYAKKLGINTNKEVQKQTKNIKQKHKDNFIQTLHFPKEMEDILKKSFFGAKQALEETGTNMLYLIIGFLEWYEKKEPNIKRYAPLVMVPIILQKQEMDTKTLTYRYNISYSGEDITTNLTLKEKLYNDFNLNLPDFKDDMTPEEYFQALTSILESIPNFRIIREISMDFLSFSKILMYLDLDEKRWPEDRSITKHPLIKQIFNSYSEKNFNFSKEYDLDEYKDLYDIPIVADADSSQHSAILDVLKNSSIVIEGPPGTGKSQTITNVIASSLSRGKKVLFVAEKLAALDVVKHRLKMVGLGDFCLEIHSHKSNKQGIVRDIEARFKKEYKISEELETKIEKLLILKNKIDSNIKILSNIEQSSNLSYFEIFWKVQRYKIDGLTPPIWERAKQINKEDLLEIEIALEVLSNFIKNTPNISKSVWYGFKPLLALNVDNRQLEELWERYFISVEKQIDFIKDSDFYDVIKPNNFEDIDKIEKYMEEFLQLEVKLNVDEINYLNTFDMKILNDLFDLAVEADKKYKKLDEISYDTLSTDKLNFLKKIMFKHKNSGFFSKFFDFDFLKSKKFSKEIFNSKQIIPEDILFKIEELEDFLNSLSVLHYKLKETKFVELNGEFEIQNIDKIIVQIKKILSYKESFLWLKSIKEIENLPSKLKEYIISNPTSNTISIFFSTYRDNKNIIEIVYNKIREYGDVNISELYGSKFTSFEEIKQKNFALRKSFDELKDWIEYNKLLQSIYKYGLAWIIDMIKAEQITYKEISKTFKYGYYLTLCRYILKENPQMINFSRQIHEKTIEEFVKSDEEILKLYQNSIAYKTSKVTLPNGNISGKVSELTEMGLLKNEFMKKTRHISLRSLLKRAPNSILSLKPCFMMSPISCAKYLEPGLIEFDLMVIDEASQIKPEDALGAIARAKQVVVVGDPKQLPPTNFFDRKNETDFLEDKTIAEDSESILDLCLQTLPYTKRLKWHYRSADESLIAFSNFHFYDNELFLFPSAKKGDMNLGIKYHYIESAKFLNQYNKKEAKIVVEKLKDFFFKDSKESLGVVAMNIKQSEYITELLDTERKKDMTLDKKILEYENRKESFFIKNLENVQGDERDVMFISFTYGKNEKDKQHQHFGPINSESGYRRLNVLITRAKKRIEVFTSMLSSDIVLSETSSEGHKALKQYLHYIETGNLHFENLPSSNNQKIVDEDFKVTLSNILRDKGYYVDIDVGVAGYFIDIAVKDPQNHKNYILAIECDGKRYSSYKSIRDRERLSKNVLKNMGWSIYRIWTLDWFNNPEGEINRLLNKLEQIKNTHNQ